MTVITFALDDTRRRFDRFWESMQFILDFMLEKGRTELDDADAQEIEDKWHAGKGEEEIRLRFSPLEVTCASGVMQKRTTEEGGGYRIPHHRLREQLFYTRLKEKDPSLKQGSVRQWLSFPPTEELIDALAQIAEDIWEKDRSEELVTFLGEPLEEPEEELERLIRRIWCSISRLLGREEPIGVRALERMLARRLELQEEIETFTRRLQSLLGATIDETSAYHLKSLLIFDVPERVEGLPVTAHLKAMWETALPWLEAHLKQRPEDTAWLRDLAVSYSDMGDVYRRLGETKKVLEFYGKALQISERLYELEPQRSDLAWDLVCSCVKMGQVTQEREWLVRARDILGRLRDKGRLPHARAARRLKWLEEVLG